MSAPPWYDIDRVTKFVTRGDGGELEMVEVKTPCDDYAWDGRFWEKTECCSKCSCDKGDHAKYRAPQLTGRERSKLFRRVAGDIGHQKFINGVR